MNGTREFDGRLYPDAQASDPVALRYMQGSPPPPDKRIRFDDDSFWKFPQLRWSLSNMRSLLTTANVARMGGAPSSLDGAPSGSTSPGIAPGTTAGGLDDLAFTDMLGVRRTWAQSLPEVYCDGILVMHRGRRIYEKYFGALTPERPHACFSITKSYAATLAAALIHEGVLEEQRLVPHYLPEMAGTAYADATLRQVLDMQIGVDYSENYADPAAGVWDYSRAGGRARPATQARIIFTST